MTTLPIGGAGPTLTPTAATALTHSWAVGQILQVTVEARSPAGVLTLRLGNTVLEARSELPAAPGQALTLQVASAGNPVVLRVVAPPAADTAIQQALRELLPRQGELEPLLNTLAGLARTPGALPAPLAALIRQFLDRLPEAQTLATPAGLRQALHASGMFLEARLAREAEPPPQDFKALLLQLQALLRAPKQTEARADAPDTATAAAGEAEAAVLPRLQQETEAALARVTLNQIGSLPHEAAPASVLLAELPLQYDGRPGVLRMQVEPDAHRQDGRTAPSWTAWLSFEPGDLGPVHCRLSVQQERVSASFWAERAATASLFQTNLGMLETGLQQAGMLPGLLHCQAGPPPLPAPPARHRTIVDERA